MNYKMMGKFISQIMVLEAVVMLPALAICVWDGDDGAVMGFLVAILVTLLVGTVLRLFSRNTMNGFYVKEGMVCVGVSWLVLSLMGAMPFWISGAIPSPMDAVFEIASGFTTTGASILTDIESLPRGILYWRSFSHWLGGMGVLVFLLALAPSGEHTKGLTMHLLRAESPGPDVGKLVPKMRTTARILYLIYILLTICNICFLLFGGMSLFDSVCTAFGTAGTGGYSVKNDSIAGYSPYLQNVCTVFMLLFGVNFSCYYLLLLGHVKSVFKDEELRMYFGVVFASIVLIVWNLRGFYGTIGETIRHVAFQVASIVTTTGFATTDFDLWPAFSKGILFVLMLLGACAGSTGGGFKCARALLLMKSLKRNIRKVLNPNRVEVVRVNDRVISENILENTSIYLVAYVGILLFSFLLISLDGFSVTTNLSAVIACVNNVGPGFELVGPTGNYSTFSDFSKLVLIFDMIAGRLEIFPLLILFSRSTWKHR